MVFVVEAPGELTTSNSDSEEFRASVWKRNVAFVVETQKLDELLRSFQGRGDGGSKQAS